MMTNDGTNFLLSFTSDLAARASVVLGSQVFVHTAHEKAAVDPHAVVRAYLGRAVEEQRRVDGAAVQIAVRGSDETAALSLAHTLFEALLNEDGIPDCGRAIDAKVIDEAGAVVADSTLPGGWWLAGLVIRQSPTVVGVDAINGWTLVAFNLDVVFSAA